MQLPYIPIWARLGPHLYPSTHPCVLQEQIIYMFGRDSAFICIHLCVVILLLFFLSYLSSWQRFKSKNVTHTPVLLVLFLTFFFFRASPIIVCPIRLGSSSRRTMLHLSRLYFFVFSVLVSPIIIVLAAVLQKKPNTDFYSLLLT